MTRYFDIVEGGIMSLPMYICWNIVVGRDFGGENSQVLSYWG